MLKREFIGYVAACIFAGMVLAVIMSPIWMFLAYLIHRDYEEIGAVKMGLGMSFVYFAVLVFDSCHNKYKEMKAKAKILPE